MPTTRPRRLTKTRFKIGCECPTKLFYTGKSDEYHDRKRYDTFLMALAEGGHLVGALSQLYYPGGHLVESLDHDESLAETGELLEQDNVTIFEPAFQAGDLFIRVDILVKQGSHLQLIEVKSKSIDSQADDPFRGKRGKVVAKWRPYILDVAFQKHVLERVLPDHTVSAYLMGVDKNAVCTVDGLHQMFQVIQDGNRKSVVPIDGITSQDVCKQTLVKCPVDDHIQEVTAETTDGRSFVQQIEWFSEHYVADRKIDPELGSKCKTCEFQSDRGSESTTRDGLRECWQEALGWDDEQFDRPRVTEIWNFRGLNTCIQGGRVRVEDLTDDDVCGEPDDAAGLSQKQRQALQVEYMLSGRQESYVDTEALRSELESWTFPLHFIDFETAAPAVPMHKGARPYEKLAFQFSHHVVSEDGLVSHAGEYLNLEAGANPNVEFLRRLKSELENDNGSIFMYSNYENTVLNQVRSQLLSRHADLPDCRELSEFVCSISHSSEKSVDTWSGARDMIDLQKVVARCYYHPLTRGSQSIKYVLPAMLNDSDYLRQKYSQPVYGARDGIESRNFQDKKWVEVVDGLVRDPYELLPRVFNDIPDGHWAYLQELDALCDGGTAMTAYMRIQNENLRSDYTDQIQKALLKYCELDTLAMVMLYEGWREILAGV
ncbi:MAG: DUF2779 domain-containing protein [Planctomycetaceae bacterium]